jgi:glycosyltransferase involved in cell wall biosynthesis
MDHPLVTVICLCYNHERFVKEAIDSVLSQSYSPIQIIIVNDASTDQSKDVIKKIIEANPQIIFLDLQKNLGNCKAFNLGLALAKGEYIVDFATDDIMMTDRLERQVNFFSTLEKECGVIFTNAIYIDESGKPFRDHVEYLRRNKFIQKIPQGDIYRDVLSTYFISSPTMLIKREVFDRIKGYDEALAYEDFDFWVRSSRDFKYQFLDEPLTKVRRSKNSLSTGWYRPGDKQLHSTYLVCKKATLLNRTEEDKLALLRRVRYELRQSVFSENRIEAELFFGLLSEISRPDFFDSLLFWINKLKLPLSNFRRLYHAIKFR